jgi:hypothetical protein
VLTVSYGVLQVPWKVQLMVSSLEEAAKYAALTSAPHSGDGSAEGLHLPSWLYARISITVVAAAVVVSWLVEFAQVLAYASAVETSAGRNRPGSSQEASRKLSPAQAHSSTSLIKAEAWEGD